jgi:hypothetical protein
LAYFTQRSKGYKDFIPIKLCIHRSTKLTVAFFVFVVFFV